MDLKDIQDLIKFVAKSGATEVDLEIDNIKISIKSPPKKRRGEQKEITNLEVEDVIQNTPDLETTNKIIQDEEQEIKENLTNNYRFI